MNKVLQPQIDRVMPKWVTPNMVTIARIAFIPPILALLLAGNTKIALIVYIIGALFDYLDGLLARARNQVTEFGKVLDAIVDKIFFVILIVLIAESVGNKNTISNANLILQALICANVLMEIWLGIKRVSDYLHARDNHFRLQNKLAAISWGKVKFIFQSIAVGVVILNCDAAGPVWLWLANFCLFMALPFGINSLIEKYR
jgi:phosphatidylglycerophosphate synthase